MTIESEDDMFSDIHGQVAMVTGASRGLGARHAGAYRWPKVSAYSVAKAAMIKLTENAAVEARQHGVVLFAFHPGLVRGVGLAQAGIRAGRTEPDEAVPESLRDIREWFISQMGSDRAVTVDRGADTLDALPAAITTFLLAVT